MKFRVTPDDSNTDSFKLFGFNRIALRPEVGILTALPHTAGDSSRRHEKEQETDRAVTYWSRSTRL